jgi:hypothetical protein
MNDQPRVCAWEVGEHFLLFTVGETKAEHLVISSHGGYFPWSGSVPVPAKTELHFMGPHGATLRDPGITASLLSSYLTPYAIVDRFGAHSGQDGSFIERKMAAGSRLTARICDYRMSKYQGPDTSFSESYQDIVRALITNREIRQLQIDAPAVASRMGWSSVIASCDVLTVRNRRTQQPPTFSMLFQSLGKVKIHYGVIKPVLCRSNILSLLAPCYDSKLSSYR